MGECILTFTDDYANLVFDTEFAEIEWIAEDLPTGRYRINSNGEIYRKYHITNRCGFSSKNKVRSENWRPKDYDGNLLIESTGSNVQFRITFSDGEIIELKRIN